MEIISLLKDPPCMYRGKPFWSWNGELDEQELLRQIDCMHEMGFGGFFIHSRTGLITEYLGEKWFKLVRKCAEYAYAKYGMETWLYDEDRWPSGTCGGSWRGTEATVCVFYRYTTATRRPWLAGKLLEFCTAMP